MDSFAWALAAFVILHVGVSATGLRARVVGMIGEGPYRGLFSLASLGLLVWLIHAFNAMRADPFDPLNEALWTPPLWLHWPAVAVSFVGVWIAATGILTPGPTLAGFETKGLSQAEPARGVLRITRHPFLWGVAVWAVGHLLANGERFGVMLFGALGAMVIFGARSIDRKGRARSGEAWDRFEAATSSFPFAAIAQGRNTFSLGEIGWRGVAGLLIAVLVLFAHQFVFGVAVLSTGS